MKKFVIGSIVLILVSLAWGDRSRGEQASAPQVNTRLQQPLQISTFMNFKPGSRLEFVDARTVRFIFPEPDEGALTKIRALHMADRQFYRNLGWGEKSWWMIDAAGPWSTGPYTLVEGSSTPQMRSERLVLEANTDYWDTTRFLKGLREGVKMSNNHAIADHWATGDVYARIVAALEQTSKSLDALTVQDLAPVDHFHARGFAATVDLGDRLPITANHHILDIGCGLGGPARYFAQRFHCTGNGIDITKPFVEAANKLTHLLGMEDRVTIEQGDGHRLPYADGVFDGAYTQHVTMNVADRTQFFAEAYRVLKPRAFFALTEHGLGPTGNPYYPLPWSEDGRGAYLVSPEETRALLEAAGFGDIMLEDTGAKYLAAYKQVMDMAAHGALPPLGVHILMGKSAPQKMRNAARNIEEGRTHPVQVICRKPA